MKTLALSLPMRQMLAHKSMHSFADLAVNAGGTMKGNLPSPRCNKVQYVAVRIKVQNTDVTSWRAGIVKVYSGMFTIS